MQVRIHASARALRAHTVLQAMRAEGRSLLAAAAATRVIQEVVDALRTHSSSPWSGARYWQRSVPPGLAGQPHPRPASHLRGVLLRFGRPGCVTIGMVRKAACAALGSAGALGRERWPCCPCTALTSDSYRVTCDEGCRAVESNTSSLVLSTGFRETM